MKVPWTADQCILCLNNGDLCEEHLIPECLGGNLTCAFLCRECNSKLGHELEANAKFDPSVVIAANHLASSIPALAKSLLDGHPHIGHSQPGPAKGYIKDGEFRVLSQKLVDGSLVQPTYDARSSLIKILRRSGCEEAPILDAIQTFDNAPENKKIEVVPGLEVVKWSIERLELDLSRSRLMDPLIPAKTAYEFLACHIGTAIYDEAQQLAEIRESLTNQLLNSDAIQVERLSSNKYEPFHGVFFEGNDPYAKVQVRLFGWLVFRVHFRRLSIQGPRFVYTHRLDSKLEDVQIIDEHDKPGGSN